MHRHFTWSLVILIFAINAELHSQAIIIRRDTVESVFKNSPSFTIFKHNYFITGAPIGATPTSTTADAKFQISFKQRLLDRPLPGGLYAHIIFTQKSFWDIYRESLPFRETNYNPGLWLAKPIFTKDLLAGVATFSLEHESNGRDSIFSRSWNYFAVGYVHLFSQKLAVYIKGRVPFKSKSETNPDILKYVGYLECEVQWLAIRNKLSVDIVARKGATWDERGSLQADLSFKPSKRKGNQYLVLQWYHGYAENLIDYQEKSSILRFGIMFKPRFYRFY